MKSCRSDFLKSQLPIRKKARAPQQRHVSCITEDESLEDHRQAAQTHNTPLPGDPFRVNTPCAPLALRRFYFEGESSPVFRCARAALHSSGDGRSCSLREDLRVCTDERCAAEPEDRSAEKLRDILKSDIFMINSSVNVHDLSPRDELTVLRYRCHPVRWCSSLQCTHTSPEPLTRCVLSCGLSALHVNRGLPAGCCWSQ